MASGDDDYDPYEFRNRPAPISDVETFIHFVKSVMGIGLLAAHDSFYNSGILAGNFLLAIVGLIASYGLHVLVRTQYILCKRNKVPLLTYREALLVSLRDGPACCRCFYRFSGITVDVFIIANQLGILCAYFAFCSINLKFIADEYWMEIEHRIWMVMCFPVLMSLCLIKNFKKLVPFSKAAIVFQFVAIIIVMYYVFQDLPPISDRVMIAHPQQWALFYGTVIFAIEAIGVVVSLENNMKTPQHFVSYFGVLNCGMAIVCVVYWFTGFFGYWKYGEDSTLGSLTINIPQREIAAVICKLFYTLAIAVTYALQCYPVIEIMWEHYLEKRFEQRATLVSYIIRVIAVTISFLLAIAVPHLELIISVTGVFSMSLLALTFPGLMELCTLWPNLGPFKIVFLRDVFLIVAGIFAWVIGTYLSLKAILEKEK